jgi:hypothetical protein
MTGFIAPYTFIQFGTTDNYSTNAILHTFQFTFPHALGFCLHYLYPGKGFISLTVTSDHTLSLLGTV